MNPKADAKDDTPPVDPPVVTQDETPAEPESSPMFKSLFEEVTDEPEHIEANKKDYDSIRNYGFETAAQKFENMDHQEDEPSTDKTEGGDPPAEDKKDDEKEEPKPPVTPIQFSRKAEEKPVEEPKPPAKKEPEPPPKPKPSAVVDTLLPEEKEHYELLKFASENLKGDYADADQKFVNFVEAHRKFVAEALAEDEEVTFDEDNEAYQKFLKVNQPKLTAAQFKEIEREQLKAEVRGEFEGELKETKKKLSEVEIRPKVEKELDTFYDNMDSALPEEAAKVLKAEGEEAMRKKFPIEHRYASSIIPQYTAMGKAWIEIDAGLTQFDPKDQTHAMMKDFMDKQVEHVKGSSQAVRDGKQFVGPDEFAKMSPEDQAKSWTLTRQNQIDVFKFAAEADVAAFTKQEYDALEAAGFKRQQAGAPPPPPPPEEDPPRVRGKSSIAPGSADGGPATPPRNPYATAILGEE